MLHIDRGPRCSVKAARKKEDDNKRSEDILPVQLKIEFSACTKSMPNFLCWTSRSSSRQFLSLPALQDTVGLEVDR